MDIDKRLEEIRKIQNPYERAVKWLEHEAYTNGVVKIEPAKTFVSVDASSIYRSERTGDFEIFTVSTQHVVEGNILQFINTALEQ